MSSVLRDDLIETASRHYTSEQIGGLDEHWQPHALALFSVVQRETTGVDQEKK
jgi:hypothetical protein